MGRTVAHRIEVSAPWTVASPRWTPASTVGPLRPPCRTSASPVGSLHPPVSDRSVHPPDRSVPSSDRRERIIALPNYPLPDHCRPPSDHERPPMGPQRPPQAASVSSPPVESFTVGPPASTRRITASARRTPSVHHPAEAPFPGP
ncbi:uncharacterized protein LOC134289644 [Aedes albopictus]|uniref:Uncharacterized protein n=1 Tax=Aedes albopictus TaxID=7160 RepID=A0ABM1ZC53_AEDAL